MEIPLAPFNADSEQNISQEFSLANLFTTLWNGRWIILTLVILFTAGSIILALTLPQIYTAQVTMLPQGETNNVGLLGKIASMAGTPVGGGGSYEGLYQEILRSDQILDTLLDRRWDSLSIGENSSLYDIFELDKPSGEDQKSRLAEFRMKELLRYQVVSFQRNKINGYMKLKISVPEDPPLAAEIANFLVDKLDEHNRSFRIGKAREQKEFIQSRLATVETELSQAEGNLTEFLSSNQRYHSSPTLVQRHGELERQARAITSIWSELRRQLELARIDEQKQSVSVDILDIASVPVRRSKPDRPTIVVFGAFIGFMLSCLGVIARRQWQIGR